MSGTTSLPVTVNTIGKTVTFSSKNPTDPTIYKGVVAGIVTFELSNNFGFDTTSYNAAVQRVDSTVGATNTLNYFVITLDNSQPQPANRIFAQEWISSGSFSVIESATVYNFSIYDVPNTGAAQILTTLRAAGYNAVQVIMGQ